jgi:hypothetical protein
VSTITIVLNLIGAGASLILLGKVLSLHYENYRRKMIFFVCVQFFAHLTIVFAFTSTLLTGVSLFILGLMFLRFVTLPSIGGIPREYKWPYLLVSLATALSSLI